MTDISVCMAAFNGMPYIATQVASILVQLGERDELVISDNGSTDGTDAYLRALGDPRIRMVRYLARRGPVPNFENAFRLASRAVVVPVDQDDEWLSNRLALVREAFEQAPGRLLCLMTEGERMDAQGLRTEPSNLAVLKFAPGLCKNLWKNSYMGCAMAFSRELLDIALPIPDGVPMHDSWLGLLAEHFGTVRVLSEPSYRYRVHARNASQVGNPLASKVAQRARLLRSLAVRVGVVRARHVARLLARFSGNSR